MTSRIAFVIIALCVLIHARNGYAARATEEDLVASALTAATKSTDPSIVAELRAKSKAHFSKVSRGGSMNRSLATAVFSVGVSSKELAQLVSKYQLELYRAELKVAAGDKGMVFTSSIGFEALERVPNDPLPIKLEKLLGQQRAFYMRIAEADKSDDGNLYREAAYSRSLRYYQAEVIGTVRSLNRFSDDNLVAALLFQGDELTQMMLQSFDSTRAAIRTQQRAVVELGRSFRDGPPPGFSGTAGFTRDVNGVIGSPPDMSGDATSSP